MMYLNIHREFSVIINNMINVNKLTHVYNDTSIALNNISFTVNKGQCMLLVGPNGAGKSTILRILAGKLLTKNEESVYVLDKDPFRCTTLNNQRSHMDINWGQRTVAFSGHGIPLQADIRVCDMMKKLQEDFPERRDVLLKILEINVNWRMHMVSDGQRRRVQLFFGLLRPYKILLMDEVTISLDALVRWNILKWIKEDCIQRGALCIYATHIFDGMDEWCTDLIYLNKKGIIKYNGKPDFNIYHQFLEWLRNEDDSIENENSNEFITKISSQDSAGGYASGRLQI